MLKRCFSVAAAICLMTAVIFQASALGPEPDPGFRLETEKGAKVTQKSRVRKTTVIAAACLVVFFAGGVFLTQYSYKDAVYLPKSEGASFIGLPNMFPTIIYQGKEYACAGRLQEVRPELSALKGSYIGKTNPVIDDCLGSVNGSRPKYNNLDSTHEFDLYTVKGYDPGFRIIGVQYGNGLEYTILFESVEGIWIRNGSDLFRRYNAKGNVLSAKFLPYSEDAETGEQIEIEDVDLINRFLDQLYRSKPVDNTGNDQKEYKRYGNLAITTKDGLGLGVMLVEGGYAESHRLNGYLFKIDDGIFNEMMDLVQ